ncbi:hypothetical protein A9Q84_00240 [Halobacteriovorax marinus]|uniref:Uncharacterized protein n=1 Tax=Halobacteriovorax marinus TaxID=97084 RepID=A0A1Y5FDF6_9BACT|nr:hypothetical protein A9Q84_00240 [Halobacteriovorax marinus]
MNTDNELKSFEDHVETKGKRKRSALKTIKFSYKIGEEEQLEKLNIVLKDLNSKKFGRELFIKDLLDWMVSNITTKDIEKVQNLSLSLKDKVEMRLQEMGDKKGEDIDIYDYIAKSLKIQ